MTRVQAAMLMIAPLALAACNETTVPADEADGATATAPTATETAVAPGATSTVAVPVPGATVTTGADDTDRVTIDRDGVEIDVGDEDTRVKADVNP